MRLSLVDNVGLRLGALLVLFLKQSLIFVDMLGDLFFFFLLGILNNRLKNILLKCKDNYVAFIFNISSYIHSLHFHKTTCALKFECSFIFRIVLIILVKVSVSNESKI